MTEVPNQKNKFGGWPNPGNPRLLKAWVGGLKAGAIEAGSFVYRLGKWSRLETTLTA